MGQRGVGSQLVTRRGVWGGHVPVGHEVWGSGSCGMGQRVMRDMLSQLRGVIGV
jgi:hypothetical protein